MKRGLNDLLHTSHCDAAPLLVVQGMIGLVQDNERTLADRLHVETGLQAERAFWIGQRRLHPSEIRRFGLSPRRLPKLGSPQKVLLAERDPCEPREGKRPIDDRKL